MQTYVADAAMMLIRYVYFQNVSSVWDRFGVFPGVGSLRLSHLDLCPSPMP